MAKNALELFIYFGFTEIDEKLRLTFRREIGREVIDEVDGKVRKLKLGTGRSLRTALVYDGRLSPAVPADRYFDFLIPADSFFLSPAP